MWEFGCMYLKRSHWVGKNVNISNQMALVNYLFCFANLMPTSHLPPSFNECERPISVLHAHLQRRRCCRFPSPGILCSRRTCLLPPPLPFVLDMLTVERGAHSGRGGMFCGRK